MTQGLDHDEDTFYQIVFVDLDSGFYYLAEVDNSEKLETMKVADTEVGMQTTDIEQWQCTDNGSMAQEPQVLGLEGRHLSSQYLHWPPSSQQPLRFLGHCLAINNSNFPGFQSIFNALFDGHYVGKVG